MHVLAGDRACRSALMTVVKLDRVVTSTGRILARPRARSSFSPSIGRSLPAILAHHRRRGAEGPGAGHPRPHLRPGGPPNLQQKEASGAALVARLKAEQAGKTYVADPASPDSMLQASIFAQRHAEYLQSINDFDARMQSDEAVIARNRQNTADYAQRPTGQPGRADPGRAAEGGGSAASSACSARPTPGWKCSGWPPRARTPPSRPSTTWPRWSPQRAVFIGKWRDEYSHPVGHR